MITIHWSILVLIATGAAIAAVFVTALCAAAGRADERLAELPGRPEKEAEHV